MDNMDEKHFDTSRGMHYRYYLSNPPSATPDSSQPVLLLMHGFPDGAALWQFIIPLLQRATNLPILAPDFLGYGGSAKPASPAHYTPDLVAQDFLDILAHEPHLATRPILPVGHDWGSYYAQRFYLLHSARCAGLITLSVAYGAPNGHPFDLAAFNAATTQAFGYPLYSYWELFTAPDGPALLAQRLESFWRVLHGDEADWVKKMFCVPGAMRAFLEADRRDVPLKPFAREGGALEEEWMRMMREGGFEGPVSAYRMTKENFVLEMEKALPTKVEKPYLFIGSTGDAVCRSDLVQQPLQQGLLSDATVRELEAGHWMPYEKPDEIADIMVKWLKEKNFA